MSHYDPINSISSYGDGDIPSPMDLGALGELFPASAQPEVQLQNSTSAFTTTADQLVSLAQSPLPLPFFGMENFGAGSTGQQAISTTTPGILAGVGALLASRECEPGDLPTAQMSRSVIHRDGDSGEAAVESLLSPPEVNLADLWLRSGQSDWMNLDQLPNGHPRKVSRYRRSRPLSLATHKSHSELEHKSHTSGDLKVAGLLQLLAKTLKNKPKNYVTGLRGELLEEGDEQLLGNTDVMVLPYSPSLPFAVRGETNAEKAKKEKDEREKAQLRRWREKKRKQNGQSSDNEDNFLDDDEMPQESSYLNFDVFDFFEKLLSKNAPGQRLDQNSASDNQVDQLYP